MRQILAVAPDKMRSQFLIGQICIYFISISKKFCILVDVAKLAIKYQGFYFYNNIFKSKPKPKQ
jgi:hypothetical protein